MHQPAIEAYDSYQKKSSRNKTSIISANGVLPLTVPLTKGKHQQKPYKEVDIAYHDQWVKGHIRSIRSSYAGSAYFDYYFEAYAELLQSDYEKLWDLNLDILKLTMKFLRLDNTLEFTTAFEKKYDTVLDFRNQSLTKSVEAVYYPQVFEYKFGFIPNMSILDLIFNLGPESKDLLSK